MRKRESICNNFQNDGFSLANSFGQSAPVDAIDRCTTAVSTSSKPRIFAVISTVSEPKCLSKESLSSLRLYLKGGYN
jgi:hypothetical protein